MARNRPARRRPQPINRKRWATVRLRVLDRDGWRCVRCGKAGRLEVDHVRPIADGGAVYDLDNLQALCRRDHFAKTAAENRARNPDPPDVAKWRPLVDELA